MCTLLGEMVQVRNVGHRCQDHTENDLAKHLAHANCTLFCAPNAQKRTGSQQGKKTIFLDVS